MLTKFILFVLAQASLASSQSFSVLSITPGGGVTLQAEPITVVFSHAVIAFGSDITETDALPDGKANPVDLKVYRKSTKLAADELDISKLGSWRYITTSIARFDLHKDLPSWPRWPSDLYVEVSINTALKSASGLDISGSMSRSWTTRNMNWNVQSVSSVKMTEATDGAWTWRLYGDNTWNKYEVPDDGVIQVSFDTEVELGRVQADGYFTCGQNTVTVTGWCGSETANAASTSQCVKITVETLGQGDTCALEVSDEAFYHELSGPYRTRLGLSAQTLVGKLPFTFEFLPSNNWAMQRVAQRGLRMWIRHGLPVGTDLSGNIAVSPQPAGFAVSVPEKYMALLEGEFMPEQRYTVTVTANPAITDGLDQALQGSSGSFTMKTPDSNILFYLPSNAIQFHPGDLITEFPLVGVAGERAVSVQACDVDAENLERVLYAVFRGTGGGDSWFCREGQTTTLDADGKVAHPLVFPASGLLVLEVRQTYGTCSGCSHTYQRLLSSADLHAVIAVSTATKQHPRGAVDVMVSRLTEQQALAGAKVELWSVASYSQAGEAEKVTEMSTTEGHARYDSGECRQCLVVVSDAAGQMAVLPSVLYVTSAGSGSEYELRAQVVFDRSIYSPGEEVTAYGWLVQKHCEGALSCMPDAAATANLQLRMEFPRYDWGAAGEGEKGAAIDLEVDAATGVFKAVFQIPLDAEYGSEPYFTVGASAAGSSVSVQTSHDKFLIADPRLPTAVLALTVPEFADPGDLLSGGAAEVECKVETFTGIPLEGIVVSFRAALRAKDACGNMGAVADAEEVTAAVATGADGVATLSLEVPASWAVADGQGVEVFASAIGPTGSPLGGSGTMMLFSTVVELAALELSVEDPLPDVTFDVATRLTLRVSELDPMPTLEAAGFRLVLNTGCADVEAATEAGSGCTVAANGVDVACADVSFSSNAETVALVVTATTDGGEVLQACAAIGMPLVRDWRRAMTVSAAMVGAGGGVDVKFRNPFGARAALAWVVWQGGHSGLLPLTQDGSTETWNIAVADDSVEYGSAMAIQVHAWLPVADPAALDLSADLSESLMSRLLGKWGLLTYSGSATVAMPAPVSSLSAAVTVTAPEIASPESTVTLEIDAGAAAGAGKAVVYVVDQSIFELEASPLPDTAGVFGEVASVQVSIAGKSEPVSGEAMAAAAATLEDLSGRDPYVRLQWTSKWIDGDYDAIVQGSEYQFAVTYGNFPWVVNYPSYFEDDYLYYWAFCTGCPYSGYTGGGYYEYDFGVVEDGLEGGYAPAAPGAEADREGAGGGANKDADDGGSAGEEGGSASGVTLREGVETVRTAFEALVTLDADGRATVEVPMPADRKKWSVRVHVVSENLKYGSAETFVTVTSDIYLSAFVPRALRITDSPTLGAIVQTTPNGIVAMEGKDAVVAVESFDSAVYDLDSAASQTVSTATSSAAALFAFTVKATPGVGNLSTLVLSLTVDGELMDLVQLSLAVDFHSRPLLIGTSRAVRAPDGDGASATWEEVVALPSFIPLESEVELSAAVSQYDRILKHCYKSAFEPLRALIDADVPGTPSADALVASAYCLSVLKSRDLPACSPRPGVGCSLHSKYLDSTTKVTAELRTAYTSSAGTLHWTSQQSRWSSAWYSVDVRLSAVALLMVRLASDNANSKMQQVSGWLQTSVDYVNYLDQRYSSGDYSWYAAHLWLAVSSAPAESMRRIMADLPSKYTFSNLKARLSASASSGDLSLRMLVNAAEGAADAALSEGVLNAIRLSSDQTGYIAWPGRAAAMEEPWQQLGLLALCQDAAVASDERVWRVAVYIGQGGGAARFPWRSRYDALSLIATGMALSKLDAQTDNTDPDVDVAVSLSGTSLWTVSLPVDDDTRSASAEVSDEVAGAADGAVLAWDVAGTGTVFTYLSAYLIPTEPWPTPVSRGFQVQKLIQLLDTATGQCKGGMITSAIRGQLVCVSLLVSSSDDVRNARVEDWSPSGLEPMDTNVDGIAEALAAMADDAVEADGQASRCPRWWGWCFTSETREVKATSVEWTVRGFYAGSREFKYIALANVPGKYVLPSSLAEDVDNPTYTGMSGTAYFVVQPDANTGAAPALALAAQITPVASARRNLLIDTAAASCDPAADTHGGFCDEATGRWMCGQAECGSEGLPAGCEQVEGEVRCSDFQETPVPEEGGAAGGAGQPLVLVTVVVALAGAARLVCDDATEDEDGDDVDVSDGGDTTEGGGDESDDAEERDDTSDATDSEDAATTDGDDDDSDATDSSDGEDSDDAEATLVVIAALRFEECSSTNAAQTRQCIADVLQGSGELGCGFTEVEKKAVAHCAAEYGCCGDWASLVQQVANASASDQEAVEACGMGLCAALDYVVTMQVELSYTVEEFDEEKQAQFIQAVADAAAVPVHLVSIESISEAQRRAGEGLVVDITIAASSMAEAQDIASQANLQPESLKQQLEADLGVQTRVVGAPAARSTSEIVVGTPDPEESSGPLASTHSALLHALCIAAALAPLVRWE